MIQPIVLLQRQQIDQHEIEIQNLIKEKGDLDRHSITMKEEIKVLTKALDMKIKDINAQIQKTL